MGKVAYIAGIIGLVWACATDSTPPCHPFIYCYLRRPQKITPQPPGSLARGYRGLVYRRHSQ